jgi:hypothetical protein
VICWLVESGEIQGGRDMVGSRYGTAMQLLGVRGRWSGDGSRTLDEEEERQSAVSVFVFCCERRCLIMGDAWREGELGRAGTCEGR